MLIKSLEQKTKLALTTVMITVAGCVLFSCFVVWTAFSLVQKERSQIYVLDGDIPFLAERATLESNFIMEAKAHIQLFHYYFFNLPPDDDYIKWTVGKAMYMADGTALRQKQALDENGFYSELVSSSSVCTIRCDSIKFDDKNLSFTYYGTQTIKRRSKEQLRSLTTTGYVETVPRTENNPHGLLITKWKTLENKDKTY